MKLCKLLLAALSATVVLGALTATASAGRLSTSTQAIRAAFSSVRFIMPEGTPDCQVTLEGSLHSRTMPKVRGSLMGFINRATLGACAAGTATILQGTLPWHVRYESFSGTLPNVIRLTTHVIGSSFAVRSPAGFRLTCLATSTAAEPAIGTYDRNTATGELSGVVIGGTIRTSCLGVSGSFESVRAVPTVTGTTTRITVTLI